MQVTLESGEIVVRMSEPEAVTLRRWIDDKNVEVETIPDELSDKLFDLTYVPVQDRLGA